MHAAHPQGPGRGLELLLAHCSALDRFAAPRPSALERLEDALGDDLARLLVNALAGERRPRPLGLSA